eukprot:CCRYP_006552-RA/>CCRYP_006552-RA protein AED:0.44 eAED:0.46 QI:0/0/0/1/0/0/2/0/101
MNSVLTLVLQKNLSLTGRPNSLGKTEQNDLTQHTFANVGLCIVPSSQANAIPTQIHLAGTNSYEEVTGKTPNISEFLDFDFWDLVSYWPRCIQALVMLTGS